MSMNRLTGLVCAALMTAGTATAQDLSGIPLMQPPTGLPGRAGAATQSAAPAGWNGGAAYYLLGTFAENGEAFTTQATLAPSTTRTDFPAPFNSAAAFWVGWGGAGGLGLRAHYFFRVESADAVGATITGPQVGTTIITPPASLAFSTGTTFTAPGVLLTAGFGTDVLTAQRSLDIHQFDFEATFQQPFGRGQLLLTAGGRYMFIIQDYTATLTNVVAAGVLAESELLTFHRDFHGGGPTVSAELRAPIGPITGYASARGSVLAGAWHENENFMLSLVDVGGVVGGSRVATNSFTAFRAAVIPVGELEIGVQVNRNMGSYPVALRAGVVSQSYFNAGSASNTSGNLHLFGVQIGLNVGF